MTTYAIDKETVSLPAVLGLTLALGVPILFNLLLRPLFLQPATGLVTATLIGITVLSMLSLSLFAITRFGDRRSLSSLGVKRLSWRLVLVAVVLGFLLSVAAPFLTILIDRIIPASETGGILAHATSYPAWLFLLGLISTAINEEVLFRAYPIERWQQRTGRPWVGALIGLAAFMIMHITDWNVSHLIGVVLPLGAVLTGLYLWQRNLIFMIIVHFFADLPMLFILLGA